jgi:tetratricopeptide (TPR) repeat protein
VRIVVLAGVLLFPLIARAECPHSDPEAINLSNEADKIRATNVDEAIAKYEQAAKMTPDHRILGKLALAYQKKEDWAKVASVSAKALELAPTWGSYAWLRGHALKELWMKGVVPATDARTALQAAVKIEPTRAEAHFDLAELLARTNEEQQALEHLTRAIELDPSVGTYWAMLADLYIRLGYSDIAEKVATEGLSFTTGSSQYALYSLEGNVRMLKRDYPGAVTNFESAKRACGQCNERGQQLVFFNLGAALALAKRTSEAMSNLNSFQKIVCRGAAAQRYADECVQAQELMKVLP